MRCPFVFVPLFIPLALVAAAAFGGPGDGQASGLPATGQLDAQRVLASRYGAAGGTGPGAGAAAAGVPHGFAGITGVMVDSTADAAQHEVPLTFGQVFAPGDLKPADRLVGKLADGATLPLQLDIKARHPDGSVRHAIVSTVVPALAAHGSLKLALAKEGAAAAPQDTAAASPKALLDQGFRACVSATIDGQPWSACADRLLAGKDAQAWLAGPISREWLVGAPLKNAQGAQHPHLAARFGVRWYPKVGKARIDVIVENDWAYEPNPRNFSYDAKVTVGGKDVYAHKGLNHLHHARWRKQFWWGDPPGVNLRRDSGYLIAARVVPHYDPTLAIAERANADLASRWTGKAIEPMGTGLATPAMPTTGGRNDIGLLPAWAAIYLLGMDPRAGQATMGTADLSGSWPIHYRDRRTDRPVSLLDHPYMTLLGHPGDTQNPATGKLDAFPECAAHACDSENAPDVSHQPNLVFLPYLLTGDHYYLEELQFWATMDAFSANPGYRDNVKGLLKPEQVRGQAWGLRTLGEAAYITPDADRLKGYFVGLVKHNLDWYNATYTDNPAANKLGVIINGYAIVYANETGLAPWQDDFFTSAVGHLADLGFKDAGRLLAWKARFPVARMVAPGTCWVEGSIYELTVRRSREAPLFGSMAEAYAASHKPDFVSLPCGGSEMAAALKLKPGEMAGFSDAPVGAPSNMQPALAYAVDVSGQPGKQAWKLFMARSVKPDYSSEPQFAIVPRSLQDK